MEQSIAEGDEEWEVKVMAAFHRLSKLPEHEPGDGRVMNEQWARRHEEFHLALVSACRSPRLLQFRKMLFDQSERYRRLSKVFSSEPRDVLAEHKAIMEAALARDTSLAKALLADHLGRTTAIVLDGMIEDEDEAAAPALAAAGGLSRPVRRPRPLSVRRAPAPRECAAPRRRRHRS